MVVRQKTIRKSDCIKVWSRAHIKKGRIDISTVTDEQLDAAVEEQGLSV